MLFLPPNNDLLSRVDSGQRRLSISQGSVSTATSSALSPIPIPNNNSANIINNSHNNNNEQKQQQKISNKTITIPTIIDAPPPDWSSKFSSLFSFVKKKSNYELEIDALKDSMIFIRPISGEEGILVHRLDKSKKYIHSLAELDIGYIYLTERDTPIIRQNQHEVTFANKIIIQCKSYKKFSIKGILQSDVTTTALEAFTKRKMTQGMLFLEEDGQLCRIFYRISDLVLNTIYANHDDTVMLQRLPNNEVRSRMKIDWEWKNPTDPSQQANENDENNKNAINSLGSVLGRFKSRMSIKSNLNPNTPIINAIKEQSTSGATPVNSNASSSSNGAEPISNDSNLSGGDQPSNIPAPPPPPAPPAPPPPPPPGTKSGAGLKLKKQVKKEKKMRQLHWNVIPKEKLKESFWDSLSPVKSNDRDQSLVEQWFSLSPPPKQQITREKSVKTLTTVNLLDLRRANNACILLSQFKLSFSDIKEAILTYDETKLSIEQLIALDAMLPITDEETAQLSSFTGDRSTLGLAERFFMEMMGIDRLKQRIQTFLFKAEVIQMMRELTGQFQILAAAIEQVKSSSRFRQMLKVILHVGSILNRGQTYLHGKGFRLDSLAKLSETKSRDEKHTVIDFVERYVRDNKPELLNFYEDLSLLESSSINISLDTLIDDVEQINLKFKQVDQEISGEGVDPNYRALMKPFYDTQYQVYQQLQELSASTLKQFTECVTFFGEDNTITTKDFFSNIFNFSQSFKKVVAQRNQQLAREEQKEKKKQLKEQQAKENELQQQQQQAQLQEDEILSKVEELTINDNESENDNTINN
ncbi:formin domain-containing protein [Heterostelium album PN500]|uniref:Formin domain-containing protein n=1 Tax=Heterostelium pallidum (strain ATCC 26659 / Pp 5 / PN500) TaxID=670386 RepID=D3AYD2_HETP5|nr:formin domain-containing protein [Heterostelium album PN500]EFA85959.1 formin domain-containing protein [Heterostelium album PN500]|eukprot:XP_020438065.1 formin domain-containing protein [Heterostelium album PN500]